MSRDYPHKHLDDDSHGYVYMTNDVTSLCISCNCTNLYLQAPFHFASAFAATSCSHVTAPSSAEWSRNRSPSANLVNGQDSTMWIIVCTSPHWDLSVGAMCHLCRLAAQRPCPVRKRFSVDHVERWRLKPGSLMVDQR